MDERVFLKYQSMANGKEHHVNPEGVQHFEALNLESKQGLFFLLPVSFLITFLVCLRLSHIALRFIACTHMLAISLYSSYHIIIGQGKHISSCIKTISFHKDGFRIQTFDSLLFKGQTIDCIGKEIKIEFQGHLFPKLDEIMIIEFETKRYLLIKKFFPDYGEIVVCSSKSSEG